MHFGDGDTTVNMSLLNVDLRCPICLGVLRDPVATECLHRFCNNCIEKCLRVGKKECPSCRCYVATRRSLRRDTSFAGLINSLYPDLDKFEDEEEDMINNENERLALKHQKHMQNTRSLLSSREREGKDVSYGTGLSEGEGEENDSGHDESAEDEDNDEVGEEDADETSDEEHAPGDSAAVEVAVVETQPAPEENAPCKPLRILPRTRKLEPSEDQVGFVLLPRPPLSALAKEFVCVSKLASVEAVLKYVATKLKIDWQSLQLEVLDARIQIRNTFTFVPLMLDLTLGKAVEQYAAPLEPGVPSCWHPTVFIFSSQKRCE